MAHDTTKLETEKTAGTNIATLPEKVYYVWDYLEWGGAQIHWFALMREAKTHCPVTVLLPAASDPQLVALLEKIGVEYEFLPFNRNIKPAPGIFQKLKRHWDKFQVERGLLQHLKKYDLKNSVLHIELAPWQSLFALRSLCRRSGQVFITMHNRIRTESSLRKALWKYKLTALSREKNFHILTSNKDARESLRPLAPASFVDDISVTYTSINPVEIDKVLDTPFDRGALFRKFALDENKFTVVCIGQFIDRKGRWTFLEAAQKLKHADEGIQFVWVSNLIPTEEDEQRIAGYGLGDSFKLIMNSDIGSERIDLFRMYLLGNVYVLASFVEGLPIALLEAMALKVPSISTNINGIPEAIFHLETGWLIEAGDSGGLAEAIVTLKNDDELRKKLGENGREIALRLFDEREAAKTAYAAYVKAFKK